MLRIAALLTMDGRAVLKLEGRLIGRWVNELEQECDRLLARGATLTLDVGEVAFVERDGLRLLNRLLDAGVAVVNCPAFVTEQLKAVSPMLTSSSRT